MTRTKLTQHKQANTGLTIKTASWISTAMMLTCVIYLSIAPGPDMQGVMSAPSSGPITSSSVFYLA